MDREYNIPLRVGLLFVILITSGLGKQNAFPCSPIYNLGI